MRSWPGATRRRLPVTCGGQAGRRGPEVAKTGRARLIDAFMTKVEELVDLSKGKIRADVAHRKLAVMGYRGSERSTQRAVAEAKQAWQAGRPWLPAMGSRGPSTWIMSRGHRSGTRRW